MMEKARAGVLHIRDSILTKRYDKLTILMIGSVILAFILMYVKAFFGTEMSDEAFYVAEAKEMLNGNVPYAYANGTQAVGFTFLLVPVEALYRLFVPDLEGVFLFTRLSFVTYKLMVWAFVFNVFKRKLSLSKALLVSALIIPLNGPILNFSYNTVPELAMFMVGCILYDVIEQDAPHKEARLIFAGVMTGVACFANPGWGIALLVFIAMTLIRVKDKKLLIKIVLYYGCTILADVIIVVASISAATSFQKLWYGFYRLFINGIPADSMNPTKSWQGVFFTFKAPLKQLLYVFVPIGIALFCILYKFAGKYWKKMSVRQTVLLSITITFFLHSMYIIITKRAFLSSSFGGDIRGFITFCYMVLFIMAGICKKDKIILYLGIYQPIYAVAELILVDADATIWRFINVYTSIIPILYILIQNKSKFVKILTGVLAVSVITSLLYANFSLIYRDGRIPALTTRVQSGVFKNLYTTEDRAKDFPELETYLNSVIEEDESYAFRDNVPFAYLMVHKGKPCEKMTWDCLQYHHGRNSPAPLFDYYRVRDMIPDKIIYIDFGKDEKLSILNDGYRYNDWVNAYYDLVEDVELNDTFHRVMVYKYNGAFDGNYEWWIKNYWKLIN